MNKFEFFIFLLGYNRLKIVIFLIVYMGGEDEKFYVREKL